MLFNGGSKHQAVRACTVPTRFEPIRRRSFVVIAEPQPGRLVPLADRIKPRSSCPYASAPAVEIEDPKFRILAYMGGSG